MYAYVLAIFTLRHPSFSSSRRLAETTLFLALPFGRRAPGVGNGQWIVHCSTTARMPGTRKASILPLHVCGHSLPRNVAKTASIPEDAFRHYRVSGEMNHYVSTHRNGRGNIWSNSSSQRFSNGSRGYEVPTKKSSRKTLIM